MKNGIITVVLAAAVAVPAAAQDSREFVVNDIVNLRNISIVQRGDSVSLDFDVVADGRNIRSKESVTVTPIVKGATNVRLPKVLVNGSQRANIYKREQALAGRNRRPEPATLITMRGKRTITGHYSHTFKVPPQSAGATLSVESFTATCCTESPRRLRSLSDEFLTAPVPSTVHVPTAATQPEQRVVLASPPVIVVEEHIVKDEFVPAAAGEPAKGPTQFTVRISYPSGRHDVMAGYGDNAAELARIDSIIAPLFARSDNYTVRRVNVFGYASIEGQWETNQRLAGRRAEAFANYLSTRYGLRYDQVVAHSRGEDWDGLLDMVKNDPYMPSAGSVESIINTVGIFDGREKRLMDLGQGVPYKYMYRNFFPRLRRLEVTIEYDVRR